MTNEVVTPHVKWAKPYAKGKTRITIYLDDDVLETFRERADQAGRGYQTMINDALRDFDVPV